MSEKGYVNQLVRVREGAKKLRENARAPTRHHTREFQRVLASSRNGCFNIDKRFCLLRKSDIEVKEAMGVF